MLGKIVLWISTLVFISYGLISLFFPEVPAGYAGLIISNGDAYAEIASMYGGLQTGIGLFCLIAAIRPPYYQSGLLVLVIGIGGITAARFIGFLATTETVTAYTYGALIYELATTVLAAVALRKTRSADQQPSVES